MVRAFLVAALAAGLLAIPGGASAPLPEGQGNPAPATAEHLVSVLHTHRVSYDKDLSQTPLPEVLADLAKNPQFRPLTFVINKEAFGDNADTLNDARATRLTTTSLDGMPLSTFLKVYLGGLNVPDVTYLVRETHIEITTRDAAQQEAGLVEAVKDADAVGDSVAVVRAKARFNLPLVCVVTEEKPLSTVLGELSRVYGVNVTVDKRLRGQLKTPVTLRLLNVPADTALELIAGQVEPDEVKVAVVRKGNSFLIAPAE